MSTQDINAKATFTVTQHDRNGREVNRFDSLDELTANNLVALLAASTAHTEGGWTTRMAADLSAEERAAKFAERWIAEPYHYPSSTGEIAAVMALLAKRLGALGDVPLPPAYLSVQIQFGKHLAQDRPDADRMAAVDLLTDAIGYPSATLEDDTYASRRGVFATVYAPKVTVEHRQVAGAKNPDGTTDIECSCGVVFGNIAPEDRAEIMSSHFGQPDPETVAALEQVAA